MEKSSGDLRTLAGLDRAAAQRPDASLAAVSRRLARIELVGLAGVGKSHLARRLSAWYGGRAIDHGSVMPSWRDLPTLARSIRELGPLVSHVLHSGGSSMAVRVRFCGRLIMHEWRVALSERSTRGHRVVIDEEGRFHKLRQLRRLTRSDIAFADLPESVRRHFGADLVLFLTADPMQICARKLLRKGIPVTPETLAHQYAESGAIGQWGEYARTRRDLEQAAERHQQRFLEIEYVNSFDLERDLVPHLRRFGLG